MTDQEIYDTVLTHLRKQGKAATGPEGDCQYRGTHGTACAIGCLIPDELYDPQIETLGVSQILLAPAPDPRARQTEDMSFIEGRIASHLGVEHSTLLVRLQHAHDVHLADYGLPAWEEQMRGIAQRFNLRYAPAGGQS